VIFHSYVKLPEGNGTHPKITPVSGLVDDYDSARSMKLGIDSLFSAVFQGLSFGTDFNQRLDCTKLPTDLETLIFGPNFNQPMDGILMLILVYFTLVIFRGFHKWGYPQ